MKNGIELLAPCGNFDIAIAAINAGADAVYLGGEKFGARANADNLTIDEIIEVIEYAHLFDRKVYLTINTLLKDKEIENDLFNFLCPLYENGLDAVIVQDIAVILFIKKYFSDLKIHASTQMTIFGKYTAKYLKDLGVERIVAPRELSLSEIKALSGTNVEIETFVHGALCYCYSGQCLLSSMIGGRSGNRGRCAQPCRLPYDLMYDGMLTNNSDDKYILSPKDICAIKILPEIVNAGVSSLKIEGRMKKLEYVTGVVSIYRKYVDMIIEKEKYEIDPEDEKLLLDLFNRNGFNESYFNTHNDKEMISLKEPTFRIENKEFVDYLNKKYSGKLLKKHIDINVKCKKGEYFTISSEIEGESVVIYDKTPEIAQNQPIDSSSLDKQLRKTGTTDFIIDNIEYDIDDGLFVNIADINNARRQFLDAVKNTYLKKYRREHKECDYEEETIESNNEILINVSVSNLNQLLETVECGFVNSVYIDLNIFPEKDLDEAISILKSKKVKYCFALPYVSREHDFKILKGKYLKYIKNSYGVLIRNIEQYLYLKDIGIDKKFIFDYNIYAYNKLSKNYYNSLGVETSVPVELNEGELLARGVSNEEMLVYGYIPVMISANCGLKTMDRCNKENDRFSLSDRINNDFNVNCNCTHCYNVMYNCNALSLFKFAKEIKELSPKSVRVAFTNESEKITSKVLELTKKAFVDNELVEDFENTTRGHFRRGVL